MAGEDRQNGPGLDPSAGVQDDQSDLQRNANGGLQGNPAFDPALLFAGQSAATSSQPAFDPTAYLNLLRSVAGSGGASAGFVPFRASQGLHAQSPAQAAANAHEDALPGQNASLGADLPAHAQPAVSPDLAAILGGVLQELSGLRAQVQSTVQNSVHDALATSFENKKRKADKFKSESAKKHYAPLEETHIRFAAARSAISEALEAGNGMAHDQLERAQDLIDEGMSFLEKRMEFYEIAEAESWPVASKMEEHELVLELSDEQKKKLKKAKAEVKEETREKAQAKSKSKSGGRRPFFQGRRPFGGGGGQQRFQPQFQHAPGGGMRGPCFSCGQFGHVNAQCPYKGFMATQQARQNTTQ